MCSLSVIQLITNPVHGADVIIGSFFLHLAAQVFEVGVNKVERVGTVHGIAAKVLGNGFLGEHAAGVLIITARDALDDKIAGLDLGADDYLIKPFHLSELNARLRAIIRRRQFNGHQQIVFRDLLVLPELAEAHVRGEALTLTKKEYDLLLYFLANPGRVLTKEAIAEHLCGDAVDSADSFDFIYTHLKNLRRKLQEKGADNYISTMYGVGYKLSKE